MEVLHAELGMQESLNEDKESLGKEFSDKFDVPASSDEDSITIRTKDIIEDSTAERMIDWIESKGYIVDRKRSIISYPATCRSRCGNNRPYSFRPRKYSYFSYFIH